MPSRVETFFSAEQKEGGRRGWLGAALVGLLVLLIAVASSAEAADAPNNQQPDIVVPCAGVCSPVR